MIQSMSVPARLRAFARYTRQLAALAPGPLQRARIAAVAVWLLTGTYLRWLPRIPLAVRVRRRGRVVRVWLQTYGDLDVLHELYVRDEYAPAVLPESAATIIDAGANIGLSTLDLRARYPDARIVAVEPDPRAAALLRRNVEPAGVEVHQLALSDADGEAELYTSETAVVAGLQRTLGDQRAVRVRTARLQTLLERVGAQRIDLLKLDVEGAEARVLAPGPGLDAVEHVVGEVHPTIVGASAEGFLAERLPGFDVALAPRPGLDGAPERLFWARRAQPAAR